MVLIATWNLIQFTFISDQNDLFLFFHKEMCSNHIKITLGQRKHHEAKIFTEPYLLVIVEAIRKTKCRRHGDYWLLLGDFRSLHTVRHSFSHAARLRANTNGGTCISTWCIPFQLWSCQQGVVVHLVRSTFCKDSKTKITLCLVWALIILTEAFLSACTPVLIRFS